MSAAGIPIEPAPAPTESFAEASRLLHTAALARTISEPAGAARVTPLLQGRFALRARTVDLAVDTAVCEATHHVLTHGWRPAEVHRFAGRRLDASALSYLVDALANAAASSAGSPWRDELARLHARVWWARDEPHIAQWAARHHRRRAEALDIAVDVLALLTYLPRTERPHPPDAPRLVRPADALVPDARIAGKIDALLARAGATTYPAEAAACTAKAQELMRRHSTPTPAAGPPDRSRPRFGLPITFSSAVVALRARQRRWRAKI